ncbi:hypothetical protein F0562_021427 [Nyssa sinensis]|uniref:RING-type E3 ubiquitin transferase n=1 Tax=Nyssa sinensis TaxID=561372 RepID=A0A5J5BKB9_9ASTE|nr:hypothetical protein F0562_021427 [Nyssa sinensis]
MDDHTTGLQRGCDTNSYVFSGKVMLISVVIIFVVCVVIVFFHSYARWLRRRAYIPRRHRPRLRRTHNIAFSSNPASNPSVCTTPQGLDPSVLKSLPTILYAFTAHDPPLECAVCLSEFEVNETGRLLPKCNHCFHIDCIDTWFQSHSNCPLCRAPVRLAVSVQATENQIETIVSVSEPSGSQPESSSGLCPACLRDENQMSCSSSSPPGQDRAKPVDLEGITVEVQGRNEGSRSPEGTDLGSEGGHVFKPPGGGREKMNPMSSIIFLLPFVLCLTFHSHSIVAQQSNGTSTLIARACQHSTHKDFCISVLQSAPNAQNTDPKALLFSALKIVAENATNTSTQITQYLNDKAFDPEVEQGLTDCSEHYVDAVEQLDTAVFGLSSNAYQDIDKWLKAAIVDIDNCEGGLQGQTGKALEVSHNNHTLRLLLNVALGVFHALSRN